LGEPSGARTRGDLSQSIVRVSWDLRQVSRFPPETRTPPIYLDWARLDKEDLDITSSGPLLTPATTSPTLIGGGKPGRLYVLDRNDLHLRQTFRATVNASNSNMTPESCTYGPAKYGPGTGDPTNNGQTLCPHIHSGLVYWRGPEASRAHIYVWGERDYLRSYWYDIGSGNVVSASGTPFTAAPDLNSNAPLAAITSLVRLPLRDPGDGSRVMPGGTLSLSANGDRHDTGILWATMSLRDNEEYKSVGGILRAFNAETLGELWNSGADQYSPEFLGNLAKYVPPTVANGRVFVPTFSNRLVVYGAKQMAKPFVAPWQEWLGIGGFADDSRKSTGVIPVSAPISPVSRDRNILDLYLTDNNGAVLNAGWWAQGDQWHTGYPVTATSFAKPGTPIAALSRLPTVVDLFATRSDGSVWDAAYWVQGSSGSRPFGWHDGYPIPGAKAGTVKPGTPVTALARMPTVVDLFAVRADGALWNVGRWADGIQGPGPFGWNEGYPIPGASAGYSSPGSCVAALARTPNIVDLYLVRSDGSVWNGGRWSNGTPGPGPFGWNPGYAIPGAGSGYSLPGSCPVAIARTPDIVDLYAIRANGSVWNAGWWDARNPGPGPFGWHAGYEIAGAGPGFAAPGARLSIVIRDPNHVDLYVVRPSGELWNVGWWAADNPGSGPFGWHSGYRIGLNSHVDPNAVVAGLSRNPSHTDLFVAAKNGQVWNVWWDGTVR
jgi:hypothetical protein